MYRLCVANFIDLRGVSRNEFFIVSEFLNDVNSFLVDLGITSDIFIYAVSSFPFNFSCQPLYDAVARVGFDLRPIIDSGLSLDDLWLHYFLYGGDLDYGND